MARAELFAQRNYFIEAARIYQANSCEDKALEMYADLRMFHRAQVIKNLKKCNYGSSQYVLYFYFQTLQSGLEFS
jgi:hypothetical protein